MDYHEMMELGDELDQQFDELVQNCLISGEIDQNLGAINNLVDVGGCRSTRIHRRCFGGVFHFNFLLLLL